MEGFKTDPKPSKFNFFPKSTSNPLVLKLCIFSHFLHFFPKYLSQSICLFLFSQISTLFLPLFKLFGTSLSSPEGFSFGIHRFQYWITVYCPHIHCKQLVVRVKCTSFYYYLQTCATNELFLCLIISSLCHIFIFIYLTLSTLYIFLAIVYLYVCITHSNLIYNIYFIINIRVHFLY